MASPIKIATSEIIEPIETRISSVEDKFITTDTVTSDEYEFTGATITNGFLTLNFEEVI
jgi:hypothetical protein